MFLYKRLREASLGVGGKEGMASEAVSASILYRPEEVSIVHAEGGQAAEVGSLHKDSSHCFGATTSVWAPSISEVRLPA